MKAAPLLVNYVKMPQPNASLAPMPQDSSSMEQPVSQPIRALMPPLQRPPPKFVNLVMPRASFVFTLQKIAHHVLKAIIFIGLISHVSVLVQTDFWNN